jgi:hypothetical protein
MKKSDRRDPADERPASPISFHPSSNGEFEPRPVTQRDRRAAAMYREIVEQKARRLGMSRREFTESASGMVAALFVLNQVPDLPRRLAIRCRRRSPVQHGRRGSARDRPSDQSRAGAAKPDDSPLSAACQLVTVQPSDYLS